MCSILICALGGLLIVISFGGFLFTFGLDDSVNKGKCAVATMSSDFLYGTEYAGTEWIGVDNAVTSLDALSANIT